MSSTDLLDTFAEATKSGLSSTGTPDAPCVCKLVAPNATVCPENGGKSPCPWSLVSTCSLCKATPCSSLISEKKEGNQSCVFNALVILSLALNVAGVKAMRNAAVSDVIKAVLPPETPAPIREKLSGDLKQARVEGKSIIIPKVLSSAASLVTLHDVDHKLVITYGKPDQSVLPDAVKSSSSSFLDLAVWTGAVDQGKDPLEELFASSLLDSFQPSSPIMPQSMPRMVEVTDPVDLGQGRGGGRLEQVESQLQLLTRQLDQLTRAVSGQLSLQPPIPTPVHDTSLGGVSLSVPGTDEKKTGAERSSLDLLSFSEEELFDARRDLETYLLAAVEGKNPLSILSRLRVVAGATAISSKSKKLAREHPLQGRPKLSRTLEIFPPLSPDVVEDLELGPALESWREELERINRTWRAICVGGLEDRAPALPAPSARFLHAFMLMASKYETPSVLRLWDWFHRSLVASACAGKDFGLQWGDMWVHPTANSFLRPMIKSLEYCRNWNTQTGSLCSPSPSATCTRVHRCSACDGTHPLCNCPAGKAGKKE